MSFAVIGGGSFGTAMAHVLAHAGHRVCIFLRQESQAEEINQKHTNSKHFPNTPLHKNIQASTNIADVQNFKYWVIALPCQTQEEILCAYVPYFSSETVLVNVAKGINLSKKAPLSLLIPALFGISAQKSQYAVLSGPSFAEELLHSKPTAAVLACTDEEQSTKLRKLFSTPFFRCYSSTDVIGVEIAGALKNIIAIAAGIGDGLEFGHNSRAALVTRGLAEISRFGMRMGAQASTFMGLSGLGDLMLTCTGDLSRNRQTGLRLGRGESLSQILGSMKGVAEGVPSTSAVYAMAMELEVEMPIVQIMYKVLYETLSPREATLTLMSRELKHEST